MFFIMCNIYVPFSTVFQGHGDNVDNVSEYTFLSWTAATLVISRVVADPGMMFRITR